MKKILITLLASISIMASTWAQLEPTAGTWKTWFISNVKSHRPPPPPANKEEISEVIARQQNIDSSGLQQIQYWNAGSPGYRWQDMMNRLWMTDTNYHAALAAMLLNVATYDATIVAWDAKNSYKRVRPFIADSRIKALTVKPESSSYPCEYSVAAGVAVTVISKYYPAMADSAKRMAQRVMDSRIAAGTAFPSDTRAGFELGKKIAEIEIESTKDFIPKTAWDRKRPEGPGFWTGKNPMFPMMGRSKTVVLDSGSQFRPAPPPDWTKDMDEIKKFKPTFRSNANAYYYAGITEDVLSKKIFEYNLHLNPPRAARIYALASITTYDAFVACWDAKYAYWGIRPDQYDTTYRSVIPTPPFPGYPSGHAVGSGALNDLYSYFFPLDRAYFQKRAKDAAESRFQGGIHFRTDNEVGLDIGRKIAAMVIQEAKTDGADQASTIVKQNKSGQQP